MLLWYNKYTNTFQINKKDTNFVLKILSYSVYLHFILLSRQNSKQEWIQILYTSGKWHFSVLLLLLGLSLRCKTINSDTSKRFNSTIGAHGWKSRGAGGSMPCYTNLRGYIFLCFLAFSLTSFLFLREGRGILCHTPLSPPCWHLWIQLTNTISLRYIWRTR